MHKYRFKLAFILMSFIMTITTMPIIPVYAEKRETGQGSVQTGGGITWGDYVDETRTAKLNFSDSNGIKYNGTMQITFPEEKVYDEMRVTALHSVNAYLAQTMDIYFIPTLEDFPVNPKNLFSNVIMADSDEDVSPLEGHRHRFADVIDEYFDTEVKTTAVVGDAAIEKDFVGSDGKKVKDGKTQYIGRFNTSKKVYSKNENSRTLQVLGYDILLADEKCVMGGDNKQFYVDYAPVYAKTSLNSKALETQTIIMDLYKALDKYIWDIKCQFTNDSHIGVETTPMTLPTDHLTARPDFGGVSFKDAACWVWASRTNPQLYWDTCRKDRIFGGSQNVKTSHMYTGEAYSVTFNKNAKQLMTLGEFCAVARAMMELYGEPVMTEREQLVMLQVYGFSLPDTLTNEQSNAVRYLAAKGIIDPTNVDFSKYVTFDDISELLLRIADPTARLTFKEAQQFNVNSVLFNEGFLNGNMEDVADITDMEEVSDLNTDQYYDYFIESEDGFSNFFLMQDTNFGTQGSVASDAIGLSDLGPDAELAYMPAEDGSRAKRERKTNKEPYSIIFEFDGIIDNSNGRSYLQQLFTEIINERPNASYGFITNGGKKKEKASRIYDNTDSTKPSYFGELGNSIWENSINFDRWSEDSIQGVKGKKKRAKWMETNGYDILVDTNKEACTEWAKLGGRAIYIGTSSYTVDSSWKGTIRQFDGINQAFLDLLTKEPDAWLGAKSTQKGGDDSGTEDEEMLRNDPVPIFINEGITEDGFYHFRIHRSAFSDAITEMADGSLDEDVSSDEQLKMLLAEEVDDGWNFNSDEIKISDQEFLNTQESEETIKKRIISENKIRIYLKKGKVGIVSFEGTDIQPQALENIQQYGLSIQKQAKTIRMSNQCQVLGIKGKKVGLFDVTFNLTKDGKTYPIDCEIEVVDKALPEMKYTNRRGVSKKYNALATTPFYKDAILKVEKGQCIVAYNKDVVNPPDETAILNEGYNINIRTRKKKPGKKNPTTYNTKASNKFYIPNVEGTPSDVQVTHITDADGNNWGAAGYDNKKGYNGIGVKFTYKQSSGLLTMDLTCVDKTVEFTVKKRNGGSEHYKLTVNHVTKNLQKTGDISISYTPTDPADVLVSDPEKDEPEDEEDIASLDPNTSNLTYDKETYVKQNSYDIDAGGGVYLLEYGDTTIDKRLNPDKQYVMHYTLDGQFISAREWDPAELAVVDKTATADQTAVVEAVLYTKAMVRAYNAVKAIVGDGNEALDGKDTSDDSDDTTDGNDNNDNTDTSILKRVLDTLSKNGISTGQMEDGDLAEYAQDFDAFNRLTMTIDSKYVDSARYFYSKAYQYHLDDISSKVNADVVADPDDLSYTMLDQYTTGVMFQIPREVWDKGEFVNFTFGGQGMDLGKLKTQNSIGAKTTQQLDVNGTSYTLTYIVQDITDIYVNIVVQGVSSIDVFKQNFKAPSNAKNRGVDTVYYSCLQNGNHDVMIGLDTLYKYSLLTTALKQKDGSLFLITKDGNNIILSQKGSTGRVWVGDTVFLLPTDQKAYIESGGKTYINSRALMGWGTQTAALVESNGKIQIIIPAKYKYLSSGKTSKNASVTSIYGTTTPASQIKGYNGIRGLQLSHTYALANYLVVIDQRGNTGEAARMIDDNSAKDYVFYWLPKIKVDDEEVLKDDEAAHRKLADLGLSNKELDRSYYGLQMIELHRQERPTNDTGHLGWVTQVTTKLDGIANARAVMGYAYYPPRDNAKSGEILKAMKATLLEASTKSAVPIVRWNDKLYNLLPNSFANEDNGLYKANAAPGFAIGEETPQTESTSDNNATVSGNISHIYIKKKLNGKWEKSSDDNLTFDASKGSVLLAPTAAFTGLHGTVTNKVKNITGTSNQFYAGTMLATKSNGQIKLGNLPIARKANNLVVTLAHAKSKSSGIYVFPTGYIKVFGESSFAGNISEVLMTAKGLVDWDKYKFSSLVKNIDSLSNIFLILILNLVPRIGMFAFFILMLLTTFQGNKIAEIFCEKVVDPVKVLTFNRQSFTTLDLKITLIQSMLALSLFFIVMDGHLLTLIEWSTKFAAALLNK